MKSKGGGQEWTTVSQTDKKADQIAGSLKQQEHILRLSGRWGQLEHAGVSEEARICRAAQQAVGGCFTVCFFSFPFIFETWLACSSQGSAQVCLQVLGLKVSITMPGLVSFS